MKLGRKRRNREWKGKGIAWIRKVHFFARVHLLEMLTRGWGGTVP